MGPTRRNTDERRSPPDDPNDMLASTAHWSIGIIGNYSLSLVHFISLAQVSCVYLEFRSSLVSDCCE